MWNITYSVNQECFAVLIDKPTYWFFIGLVAGIVFMIALYVTLICRGDSSP